MLDPSCSQTKTLHTVQTIPHPLQPKCLQSSECTLPSHTPSDPPAVLPQLHLLPLLSHPSPQPVSSGPLFHSPPPPNPFSVLRFGSAPLDVVVEPATVVDLLGYNFALHADPSS